MGQLEVWTAAVRGEPYEERSGDLRGRLDAAGPAFVEVVRDASDRLGETFVDAVCEPPEVFTYSGMIAHVLTFGAYRRTLALDCMDSDELRWGDPMRFVAA